MGTIITEQDFKTYFLIGETDTEVGEAEAEDEWGADVGCSFNAMIISLINLEEFSVEAHIDFSEKENPKKNGYYHLMVRHFIFVGTYFFGIVKIGGRGFFSFSTRGKDTEPDLWISVEEPIKTMHRD